jgi:hypothetical protein
MHCFVSGWKQYPIAKSEPAPRVENGVDGALVVFQVWNFDEPGGVP